MASCPLCTERAAKRYCPAKETHICGVCCGSKREIEIDCPGSCPYLRAARSYEAQKRVPNSEWVHRIQRYDAHFVRRYREILQAISAAIAQEYTESRWLVDRDVIEVLQALTATLKTLSSGIYYESLPEGPVRLSLFRRLRSVFDEFMKPQLDRAVLKVSEALEILDLFTLIASLNAGERPRSRRYLDQVISMMEQTEFQQPSSGLIIPGS